MLLKSLVPRDVPQVHIHEHIQDVSVTSPFFFLHRVLLFHDMFNFPEGLGSYASNFPYLKSHDSLSSAWMTSSVHWLSKSSLPSSVESRCPRAMVGASQEQLGSRPADARPLSVTRGGLAGSWLWLPLA